MQTIILTNNHNNENDNNNINKIIIETVGGDNSSLFCYNYYQTLSIKPFNSYRLMSLQQCLYLHALCSKQHIENKALKQGAYSIDSVLFNSTVPIPVSFFKFI